MLIVRLVTRMEVTNDRFIFYRFISFNYYIINTNIREEI